MMKKLMPTSKSNRKRQPKKMRAEKQWKAVPLKPSATTANPKKRAAAIVQLCRRYYPDATCALHHKNPLQLLIATILSAQCTDERVNLVTPRLFERYPNAQDFAQSDLNELEALIRSTGFYKNKARSIQTACRTIVEKH